MSELLIKNISAYTVEYNFIWYGKMAEFIISITRVLYADIVP